MKSANVQQSGSTIRFSGQLFPANATTENNPEAVLTLPRKTSAGLPSEEVMVEGTCNAFPFRAALELESGGSHRLRINKDLQKASGAGIGDTVTVEVTRVGEESEVRTPSDLSKALGTVPQAQAMWSEITPMARRDWILWISSAKQEATRQGRIEKACDMLASGKRRVCCFGGLNWLTKDYPKCDTWQPLPDAKKRSAPKLKK